MRSWRVLLVLVALMGCSVPQDPQEVSLVEPSVTPDDFMVATREPTSTQTRLPTLPTPLTSPTHSATVTTGVPTPLPTAEIRKIATPTALPQHYGRVPPRKALHFIPAEFVDLPREGDYLTLLDWSPDGQELLYAETVISKQPVYNRFLFRYNLTSQQRTLVFSEVITVSELWVDSLSYTYRTQRYSRPRYIDDCCTILLSQRVDDTTQELFVVDHHGQVLAQPGRYPLGPYQYTYDGQVVIIDQHGLQVFDAATQQLVRRIDLPDVQVQSGSFRLPAVNRDGQVAFVAHDELESIHLATLKDTNPRLVVLHIDDPAMRKEYPLRPLIEPLKLSIPPGTLADNPFFAAAWSKDGQSIALGSCATHKFGPNYAFDIQPDGSNLKLFNSSMCNVEYWSPDKQVLANLVRGTQSAYKLEWLATSPIYIGQPTVHGPPVWSPDSQRLAIQRFNQQHTIVIYEQRYAIYGEALPPPPVLPDAPEVRVIRKPLLPAPERWDTYVLRGWSPDGKYIFYGAYGFGSEQIELYRLELDTQQRLLQLQI